MRRRVSWLIPVRDGGAWLGAAVRSALDECGPDDEIVVIDDGSAIDPAPLLPPDPRIHLLHQPPLGIVAALERGRAACRGAFVARLDADDEALPGRVQAQLALLSDPSLVVVGGRARIRRDDGEVPEGMRAYVDWVSGLRDPGREILVESPLFHPAVMFRADAVQAAGGYRSGDLPEDYELWLRLCQRGGRLANVDQDVVILRDRSDRLTRTDPRYRREAFLRVKMDWLAERYPPGLRVAVWGAGRTGRPWIRWVREAGHQLVAVLDPFQGGVRQQVAVRPPDALVGLGLDLLLVAVGSRGARALIREEIGRLRPDLAEGVDWWAVA